ncbi:uncharacterized protein TNCV_106411 [Trichonephila clavipes]|nr:uncharacterized protein TNCV_106411 [Trichonephila clavipes]
MGQWAIVLFTESCFSLTRDFRRTFSWRDPGTCYLTSHLQEIHHYHSRGLMVRTDITLDDRTRFHVSERGTVTAARLLSIYGCSRAYLLQPLRHYAIHSCGHCSKGVQLAVISPQPADNYNRKLFYNCKYPIFIYRNTEMYRCKSYPWENTLKKV